MLREMKYDPQPLCVSGHEDDACRVPQAGGAPIVPQIVHAQPPAATFVV